MWSSSTLAMIAFFGSTISFVTVARLTPSRRAYEVSRAEIAAWRRVLAR
jgi:hypothetical protein